MNSLETFPLNLVVKEGWQRWKLSHAFNLIGSGTTPPTGSVEYFQKEIPWVNTGDLNDGYIYSVNKFVSEKAVSDFSALKVFPTDSLIIALYGATIGKLGILKIDACTNQACCILSEPNHLNTKFVFYWLMSERNNIIELAQGGGQPNISQEIVKNLRVFAPDIETQKLIATFLDRKTAAIDILIDKKQRLIQLLEEKRTALINQAVTKGLNPHVPMKDSGIPWIGEIPEHWEIRRFRHCGQIKNGQVDPKLPDFACLPLYAPNHIQSGTGELTKKIESAKDQGAISGKYLVDEGEIVYSKIRPELRKVCIAPKKGLCSADMYAISPLKGVINKFLFWSLLSEGFSRLAILESDRVAMPKINRDTIADIPFTIPPEEEQYQIVENIELKTIAIESSHNLIEAQIEKLQEYRRSLITAAVTGKLNIKEVETNV